MGCFCVVFYCNEVEVNDGYSSGKVSGKRREIKDSVEMKTKALIDVFHFVRDTKGFSGIGFWFDCTFLWFVKLFWVFLEFFLRFQFNNFKIYHANSCLFQKRGCVFYPKLACEMSIFDVYFFIHQSKHNDDNSVHVLLPANPTRNVFCVDRKQEKVQWNFMKLKQFLCSLKLLTFCK